MTSFITGSSSSLFDLLPQASALKEYATSLFEEDSGDFLTHYNFIGEKGVYKVVEQHWLKSEFMALVGRTVSLLTSKSVTYGTRVVHFMSGNCVEDLALRTASIFIGSVPVTVNWQADSIEQIKYKISVTDSKLVSSTLNICFYVLIPYSIFF